MPQGLYVGAASYMRGTGSVRQSEGIVIPLAPQVDVADTKGKGLFVCRGSDMGAEEVVRYELVGCLSR